MRLEGKDSAMQIGVRCGSSTPLHVNMFPDRVDHRLRIFMMSALRPIEHLSRDTRAYQAGLMKRTNEQMTKKPGSIMGKELQRVQLLALNQREQTEASQKSILQLWEVILFANQPKYRSRCNKKGLP